MKFKYIYWSRNEIFSLEYLSFSVCLQTWHQCVPGRTTEWLRMQGNSGGHLVQPPWLKQDHLQKLLRTTSRQLLNYSKEGDPATTSLVPLLSHPHNKEVFPGVCTEPPMLQFVPIAFYSVIGHLSKEPCSILFACSSQVFSHVLTFSKAIHLFAVLALIANSYSGSQDREAPVSNYNFLMEAPCCTNKPLLLFAWLCPPRSLCDSNVVALAILCTATNFITPENT